MKQVPVTREALKEELKVYPTKIELREVLQEFKDDIFNRLDDISGQLETIRDEQVLAYGQHKNLEEEVENHEKRITALEPSHS